MESIETGKAALISSIEADARAEEEKIVKEAQVQSQEKKRYAEKKVESILNDAKEQADKEAQAVRRKILSDAELEIKRRSLQIRGQVIQEIIDCVEKKLLSMIDSEQYRPVLINWIVEAAVGLGVESAKINASEKERKLVDEQLLSEAREKIFGQTGKATKLSLSDAMPLKGQGIVLTSADGRIAFNNQIKTRLSRNNRNVQTMIYDALFSGNSRV